jgi:putative oxidoreductase
MERIDYALLIIRVAFGFSMALHGFNKWKSGITGTTAWFSSIGMKWAPLQAWTATMAEIIAGVLFAVGLLTGVSASVLVSLMMVAIVTVHWKVGYFIFLPNGGWEYCGAIIFAVSAVGIAGPGRISLDALWDVPSNYGMLAAPIGVFLAVCHLAISYRPSASR